MTKQKRTVAVRVRLQFTPEQQREISGVLWAAFDAIAHDLFNTEGMDGRTLRSLSRRQAIETAADYVDMYGGRITDPAVKAYFKGPMDDLVEICVAGGYWNDARYSA